MTPLELLPKLLAACKDNNPCGHQEIIGYAAATIIVLGGEHEKVTKERDAWRAEAHTTLAALATVTAQLAEVLEAMKSHNGNGKEN